MTTTTKEHAPHRETLPDSASLHSKVPMRLWIAGTFLRALLIATLVVLTARVSAPQSERIWSAYETPTDLVRMALGAAVCLWILINIVVLPKDAEAYRTWVYLGLAIVPFALVCAIAVW